MVSNISDIKHTFVKNRFECNSNGVRSVHFSKDCALLVSGGHDGAARVFDLAARRLVSEMGGDDVVNTLSLHQVCDLSCEISLFHYIMCPVDVA